ncbi:XRE family transcriptional regulator, partial [Hymenobacter persicinus]
MPRRAPASQNVISRLRAWFGLRQEDVAFYANVSPELVQAAESGRRSLSSNLLIGLLPL